MTESPNRIAQDESSMEEPMKKKILSIVLILIIVPLFFFFISSCGPKDIDKVGDAQACLNSATSATASSCMSKVDGLETTAAYNIRCAAMFIQEGFTSPTKFTNALNSLNGTTGTSSFMGLITFSSQGTIASDDANAATAFDYCYKSGGKGATLISAFGYMATSLYKAMSCTPTTPTATGYDLAGTGCLGDTTPITGKVSQFVIKIGTGDSSALSFLDSLGAVVLATKNVSCSSTTSTNEQLCTTLKNSVTAGNGSNRRIGCNFLVNIVGSASLPASTCNGI